MNTLAPRPRSLVGKVGVLLDISKPRGVDFLDRVEEVLRQNYRVKEIIRARKRTFTKPAPNDLLADLARRADFVILALADCGLCNTCIEYESLSVEGNAGSSLQTCGLSTCVDEALFFEGKGVPTAVVATVEYVQAARAQEAELGLPQYPIVTVHRSIQRLLRDEVRRLADKAMEAIVSRLIRMHQVTAAVRSAPAISQ